MKDKGQKNMQQTPPQAITLTKPALLKYTLFSLIFAAITLLTIILPAEYNIDPTGIGHKLGLTVFNNVQTDEALSNTSASSDSATAKGVTETIEVTVPAGRGVEYKFVMAQYQKLEYEWITDSTALYFLDCGYNQITSLDVSSSEELTYLICNRNQLTSLDLPNSPALYHLNCSNNQLTQLNISGCFNLICLDYKNNPITSINVSGNTQLKKLWCNRNLLTQIDTSECPDLEYVKQ